MPQVLQRGVGRKMREGRRGGEGRRWVRRGVRLEGEEEEEESSDGGARGGGFLAEGLYPRRRARIRVQEEEESAPATPDSADVDAYRHLNSFLENPTHMHACA
jgi:hypothetical protein